MAFVLTSVGHHSNARQFTFELAGSGPVRVRVVVVADLVMARKYEIPLQELPLLCLHLLDGRTADTNETVVFGEADMIAYAQHRAEVKSAAEQKRRLHRVPRPGQPAQQVRFGGVGDK